MRIKKEILNKQKWLKKKPMSKKDIKIKQLEVIKNELEKDKRKMAEIIADDIIVDSLEYALYKMTRLYSSVCFKFAGKGNLEIEITKDIKSVDDESGNIQGGLKFKTKIGSIKKIKELFAEFIRET